MKSILYNIIICSLLGLLPSVAMGQTTASATQQWSKEAVQVRQKPGIKWQRMLWNGGMVRTKQGNMYMVMPNGLDDVLGMNYVDGYTFGLHSTLGYMSSARNCLELEESVLWAEARHTWMAKGVLRWLSPVEMGMMLELHGGRHTEDLDYDPVMPVSQTLLASGLFGWNHYKLLERTDVGLRTAFPIAQGIDLKFHTSWQRRREMQNHKQRNLFGAHAQNNVPRVRMVGTDSNLRLYDGEINGDIALWGMEMVFEPKRMRYVYDDMTCTTYSPYPRTSLRIDGGAGKWHYLSVDLRIAQELKLTRRQDQLQYFASLGGIAKHGSLSIVDWHHLDASRFWWQGGEVLSHFAMLDNYELSTDRAWLEVHTEWSSDCMAITQLIRQADLMTEYLQAHFVKVPDHPAHWELHYGIDLMHMWRMGIGIGMDGTHYRGVVFTMNLDLRSKRLSSARP